MALTIWLLIIAILARVGIGYQVEVSLSVADFGIGESVPLFRKGAQRLAQDGEGCRPAQSPRLCGCESWSRRRLSSRRCPSRSGVWYSSPERVAPEHDLYLAAAVQDVAEGDAAHPAKRGYASADGDEADFGFALAGEFDRLEMRDGFLSGVSALIVAGIGVNSPVSEIFQLIQARLYKFIGGQRHLDIFSRGFNLSLIWSSFWTPAGVLTSISSPTRLSRRASPTGESLAILPSSGLGLGASDQQGSAAVFRRASGTVTDDPNCTLSAASGLFWATTALARMSWRSRMRPSTKACSFLTSSYSALSTVAAALGGYVKTGGHVRAW